MLERVTPAKTYVGIYAVLITLTVTTVVVATINLGPLNTVAALSIAVMKALLVALFFMQVRYSSRLTWVFASAGVFWLLILLAFLMGDIVSRGWLPQPSGWGG
jgi:cytochrome c oxidase subunit 4